MADIYISSESPAVTVGVKGNGTQPFTFPGISLGENSAHQLLISPGTHYCWVGRGTVV